MNGRSPGLGVGLIVLGGALAVNSLLGPLVLDVIRYRFSDSLVYQGIGLDFVSLIVVAPLAVVAGARSLHARTDRGWRQEADRARPWAGPALGLGVGAYTAYMAVQYVVGPEYLALEGNNERFFLLHLGLLILGLATCVGAWRVVDAARLPPATRRGERVWGGVLLAVSALLVLRYLPAVAALTVGEAPRVPEFRENPTSFLLIAALDLGVFLPMATAAGVGLRRGALEARKAVHLVLGWFALVGLAVAAMAVTMLMHGDPAMSVGQATGFVLVGAVLAALYARLEWPLSG